jgi:hypothetical protein
LYYTIALVPHGREKQTDAAHLRRPPRSTLPPAPPPAYEPPPVVPSGHGLGVGAAPSGLPVHARLANADREWEACVAGRRAATVPLATHQGRLSQPGRDSTNGCTVIGPLVAYRHITSPAGGASSADIDRVIDSDAPPVLAAIRAKHGLAAGSFIVPADVHDYLYDSKILKEENFRDVFGGSLLEEAHLASFIESLSGAAAAVTVAAALFFHEHVTCVLRMRDGTFEHVDSLPCAAAGGRGARYVCAGPAELAAHLRWYGLKKLTANDAKFADTHGWDDSNFEFDPRVFQGFVWQSGG